jgi:hypothetical protein
MTLSAVTGQYDARHKIRAGFMTAHPRDRDRRDWHDFGASIKVKDAFFPNDTYR